MYLLTIKKEVQLGKRRAYDDNFKARAALEAIKGEKTISELELEFLNKSTSNSRIRETRTCGEGSSGIERPASVRDI